MTRTEFMTRLRRGLAGLPATTIADIVADHEAHFADAMAEGFDVAGFIAHGPRMQMHLVDDDPDTLANAAGPEEAVWGTEDALALSITMDSAGVDRVIAAARSLRPDLRIVARALEEPLRRILINAAEEPDVVLHQVLDSQERNYGYNAATRSYGDLLAMGVIDPAKVTRLALQNAGSIASLILSIDCMIAVGSQRTGAAGPLPGADPNPY